MQDNNASNAAIEHHGKWLLNVMRAAYLTRTDPKSLMAASGFDADLMGMVYVGC